MTELFLVVRIADRGIAIPTEQIGSVIDIGDIVAVPGAPPAIRGLAALRSRVVTVVDTALALGERAGDGVRAVITKVDGHEYALLVDELEDVVPFVPQPLSSGLALDRMWGMAGSRLVERDGEPLLVLDVAALVPTIANAT